MTKPVLISLIVLGLIGFVLGAIYAVRHLPIPVIATGPAGTFPGPSSDLGRQAYAMCLGCHGMNGRGIAGYAPALAGSSWLIGDPSGAVLITLHGLNRAHETGTISQTASMLGYAAALTDQEIAALLTWTRNQWGNQASAIGPELVTRIRAQHGKRMTAWNTSELLTALKTH